MLAEFRSHFQRNLVTATLAFFLSFLAVRGETLANDVSDSRENQWLAMEFSAPPLLSQILHDPRRSYEPQRSTVVITHGMGGTKAGDRFHQLADGICQAMPECNVLIVDWSKNSCQTGPFGIPIPLAVAWNINPVAREASRLLKTLQIDPSQTTFIGESFGNWVNAQIAKALGGRGRILAFNPATAAGGYTTPDLRACSDVAWSFHTYSIFDTQDSIADLGFFLETAPAATDRAQHIAGVSWLTERVRSGNLAWLHTTHDIIPHQPEHFDATATLSGEVLHQSLPRQWPKTAPENSRPAVSMLATSSLSGIQE
jgi:hypothetical protein